MFIVMHYRWLLTEHGAQKPLSNNLFRATAIISHFLHFPHICRFLNWPNERCNFSRSFIFWIKKKYPFEKNRKITLSLPFPLIFLGFEIETFLLIIPVLHSLTKTTFILSPFPHPVDSLWEIVQQVSSLKFSWLKNSFPLPPPRSPYHHRGRRQNIYGQQTGA